MSVPEGLEESDLIQKSCPFQPAIVKNLTIHRSVSRGLRSFALVVETVLVPFNQT